MNYKKLIHLKKKLKRELVNNFIAKTIIYL